MPVGIITGGASGIGAALAKELVSSNAVWKVIIGDKNVEGGQRVAATLGKDVIFVECDVSNYDELVKLFITAIENFGRIDFVAANAGVGETFDVPKSVGAQSVPLKPALTTIDTDLYGPVYTAYLAIHYFRNNPPPTGGRFVVTSSAAGLYGVVNHPTYCAAKFGCVGLIRSLGLDKSLKKDGITFNAICPAVVETGIAPQMVYKLLRETMPDVLTPMSTIMKGFNTILESDMTGEVLECNGELVVQRPQHDPLTDHLDRLSSFLERSR